MTPISLSENLTTRPLINIRMQEKARLSLATIGHVPSSVWRPAFDVTALRPGILHLGCGAFHRAHQALMTQQAIEAEQSSSGEHHPPPWGITAVSLVRPSMRDILRPQNGLYTVLERSSEGVKAHVVGSLREVLFAPEDFDSMFARFEDPAIRIITLTVTADGYCLDPTGSRLLADHPAIQHDLGAAVPSSAIGVLVEGLARVRAAGGRPPVVLSCDNLAANGRALRSAAIAYAALRDDRLSAWIAGAVQFPCTMVDRIVPAVTDTDRAEIGALLGLDDAAAVSAEPFRQWVIEHFDGPRPCWEEAGAEFVSDVAPWEASKLRLLNGTHMAIAYLGTLAGLETVAEVVAWPAMADYTLRFMLHEQCPTLPSSDHDIKAYAHQLLERWRNPAIAHHLARVGRDGSQKLAARLLTSLRENLVAGRPAPCTMLAVAAWMLCASGRGVQGRTVAAEDAILTRLHQSDIAVDDDAGLVRAFLDMDDIFGVDLSCQELFSANLVDAVSELRRNGPLEAVTRSGAA